MFELAYETAKGVNIHFYLLSKLFMSISPPLYAETNTWREPEPERWINKDFVTVRGCFCVRRDCGGKEYFIECSLWHEINTLFQLDVKASQHHICDKTSQCPLVKLLAFAVACFTLASP